MGGSVACSFCGRKVSQTSRLVRAECAIMICLECAQRCVSICEADDARPINRFPRPIAVPKPPPDDRHLQMFLHYARGAVMTGTPDPVMPWICEFMEFYEMAVIGAVRDTFDCDDTAARSNRISRAFEALMEPYRGDRRRPYLGAVFSRLLGRSIREGFTYHVDMTAHSVPADVNALATGISEDCR